MSPLCGPDLDLDPHLDPHLDDSNPVVSQGIPAGADTPPHRDWLQKVERFRIFFQVSASQDRPTHGHTDMGISVTPTHPQKLR